MVTCVVINEKQFTKTIKKVLEQHDLLNKKFRITETDHGIAIPINGTFSDLSIVDDLLQQKINYVVQTLDNKELLQVKFKSPLNELKCYIQTYLTANPVNCSHIETVLSDIPTKWDLHGDLVMFPDTSFRLDFWESLPSVFWVEVSKILGVERIALKSRIRDDDFRTPKVKLLLGKDVIVTHNDNGIIYSFDITKNMFAKGNISEKLRIATFDCSEEVVVDMFAGIGYFVLPYLLKANAKKVYACEWNPHAVDALKRNLSINQVTSRCKVIFGDNREVTPKNLADRVNLGLIPTSSASWKAACECLNQTTGGWLHIHENVESKLSNNVTADSSNETTCSADYKLSCRCENDCLMNRVYKGKLSEVKRYFWCSFAHKLKRTLESYFPLRNWNVNIENIEYLKSYAPHVDNLIFDVKCRPVSR